MNTKDIKNKPFIKTLSTTLACLVASSAFALDDRFDDPKPQEDPKPKPEAKLPDLVPMGIKLNYDHEANDYHYYGASVSVANFGTADATKTFHCRIGYKVLGTTDPVNWPVGSLHIGNQDPIFFNSLKVAEIADFGAYYFGTPDFAMPTAVTGAEIFLIVDHYYSYYTDENWENDTGADYVGDVTESDEANNVLSCTKVFFPEYYLQYLPPVVEKSPLPVRKK